MLVGRELHNKEGKGVKEEENVVNAKSLQLDSPITDGTQTQTYTHLYMLALCYIQLFSVGMSIMTSSVICWIISHT
jgi:hypothetical protein